MVAVFDPGHHLVVLVDSVWPHIWRFRYIIYIVNSSESLLKSFRLGESPWLFEIMVSRLRLGDLFRLARHHKLGFLSRLESYV